MKPSIVEAGIFYIQEAKTVEDLHTRIKHVWCTSDSKTMNAIWDEVKLPTFGEAPSNVKGLLSWDERLVLVADDDFAGMHLRNRTDEVAKSLTKYKNQDVKGVVVAGYRGTATAGHYGTAFAGYEGTVTVGGGGTAIVGNRGVAIAGDDGNAMAGYKGSVKAGHQGRLEIEWFDDEADRMRKSIAYVGENGIKPNTAYRLDDEGNFIVA